MKKVFHFYADPGHGWLAVKKQYLVKLGIAEQITRFSYRRGDTVYLEEDCDLSRFLDAVKKYGDEADIKSHHTDRRSRIRSYESYSSESICFLAVATVHDPRTNAGMNDSAAMQVSSYSRAAAIHQAECWSRNGYWSAVYDKATGEAVCDYSPKGGIQ